MSIFWASSYERHSGHLARFRHPSCWLHAEFK